MPDLSVIIPTHNAAATLGRALDSVLHSRGVSIEIVVVDDGSVDETPAVLQGYGTAIKVLRTAHQGVSAARNLGLSAVTAPWLAFVDDDDEVAADHYRSLLDEAERAEAEGIRSDLIMGEVLLCDAQGQPYLLSANKLLDPRVQKRQNWEQLYAMFWCGLYRREVCPPWRAGLTWCEDLVWLQTLLARCRQVHGSRLQAARHIRGLDTEHPRTPGTPGYIKHAARQAVRRDFAEAQLQTIIQGLQGLQAMQVQEEAALWESTEQLTHWQIWCAYSNVKLLYELSGRTADRHGHDRVRWAWERLIEEHPLRADLERYSWGRELRIDRDGGGVPLLRQCAPLQGDIVGRIRLQGQAVAVS